MTDACRRLRPILFRVAEGEASPEEALLAARHLPTCTGCRILLHREHRLAHLLEEELGDSLQPDEGFLSDVMEAIPAEPPPRRRRLLRAVGGTGLLALGSLVAGWRPASDVAPTGTLPFSLPDLTAGDRLVDGVASLVQLLVAAVAQAGASLAPALPALPHPHLLAVTVVPALGVVLALGSLLLLLAARTVLVHTPHDQDSDSLSRVSSSAGSGRPRRLAASSRSPRACARVRRT